MAFLTLPRLVLIPLVFCTITFIMNMCYIGWPSYDVPLTGIRARIYRNALYWMCWLQLFIYGYLLHHEMKPVDEVDYSKYLGQNWRNEKLEGKRVSTLISNHIGFVDTLVYGAYSYAGRIV